MLNKIIEDVDTLYEMDYVSEEDEYKDNYKKKSVLISFLINSLHFRQKQEKLGRI